MLLKKFLNYSCSNNYLISRNLQLGFKNYSFNNNNNNTNNVNTNIFYKNTPIFNFATKMRQGVTKNKKDSAGKRLGLKKFGGEEIRESQIILRQRGFKWKPGENVHYGKDQTLHASKEGIIKFTQDPWSRKRKMFVHVVEQEIPNRKVLYNFKNNFRYSLPNLLCITPNSNQN
jgi:large subunit ribosomal protein L27